MQTNLNLNDVALSHNRRLSDSQDGLLTETAHLDVVLSEVVEDIDEPNRVHWMMSKDRRRTAPGWMKG